MSILSKANIDDVINTLAHHVKRVEELVGFDEAGKFRELRQKLLSLTWALEMCGCSAVKVACECVKCKPEPLPEAKAERRYTSLTTYLPEAFIIHKDWSKVGE